MEAILDSTKTIVVAVPATVKSNRLLFIICFLSSMLGGSVSTIMSVYLPAALREFSRHASFNEATASAVINAAFILGWTCGGICLGISGDRFGRKRTFVLSTAILGLFTLFTGAATSWEWVAVFRFLSGFGIGGVLVITTIMISEAYSDKKRAVLLGILSISIPVGIFAAGLLNYLVNYWRYGFAIGLFVLLIAVAAVPGIRGQTATRRLDTKVQYMHRRRMHFEAQDLRNLFTGTVIFGTALIGLWAVFSWMPYWIQSMVKGIEGQQSAGISMMLMGAGGLSGGFVSGWLVNRLGVKRLMLICFGMCYLLCFLLFRFQMEPGTAMYLQIAVLAFFFGISQGALSVLIPELFPAYLAGTATGLCFNIGRVFTATAVFYIGSLVSMLGGYGNALFIFSFVFVLGFLFTVFSKHHSPSIIQQY